MTALETTNRLVANGRASAWPRRPLPFAASWAYGEDRPYAMVRAAVQTLARAGETWQALPSGPLIPWVRQAASLVASGGASGIVLFCEDPALAACVANKTPGLRAAAVATTQQAAKATLTMCANLLAVEMPARTFFEIRFILQTLRTNRLPCPSELMEVDCAHR